MKVNGTIPGSARTFEEILREVRASKVFFHRILRTMHASGYLTDGVILSALAYEERRAVGKIHSSCSEGAAGYADAELIDVSSALPPYLGPAVETADYAGEGRSLSMVLLRGAGRESLIEARAFLTLLKRHPDAEWRFAKGRSYPTRPLVLLEPGGFRKGYFLGAVSPLKIEGWERPPPPPSEESLELHKSPLRYVPS